MIKRIFSLSVVSTLVLGLFSQTITYAETAELDLRSSAKDSNSEMWKLSEAKVGWFEFTVPSSPPTQEFQTFDVTPSNRGLESHGQPLKTSGDQSNKPVLLASPPINLTRCKDGLPAKDAVDICSEVIKNGRANAAVYKVRGNAHVFLKNLDAALSDYQHAMQLQPNWDSPYFNESRVYYDLGKLELALWDLETVLYLNPKKVKAWRFVGDIYYVMRRYNEAVVAYDTALKLDGSNKHSAKWKRKAKEAYDKRYALPLFTYSSRSADELKKTGKLDAAIIGFSFTIDKMREQGQSPERNIFMARAIASRAKARFDNNDAKTATEEVFDLLAENLRAMLYFPDLIIKAANYDLIQQPNNVVLLDTLAQAYSANSKFDESAKVRSKILILARNDYERASAHFDRGMAFTFAGKHNNAISDYTQAIRVIPSAALYGNRASSYASIGNLTASITDYTTALSMSDTGSDNYNRYLLYRAQVLTKAGQFLEAITDYRRLIEISPSNVEARKALILVLADSGKLDEAKISLTEFKEKFSKDFKQFRSKLIRIPTLADQSGISASNRLKPRLEAKGERALLHQIKELVRGGKWIMYGKNRIEYKASPVILRPALSGHLQIVNVTCVSDGPQSDRHPVTKGERLIKGCPNVTPA